MQGVSLQGVSLQGVSLQGVSLQGVSLQGTTLQGQTQDGAMVSGKDLIGAQLTGVDANGGKVALLIANVETNPADPEGEVLLYTLLYEDPVTHVMTNPCKPDPQGLQRGIPVSGLWDQTGAHSASRINSPSACTSGVIAKCVRWGYKPWKTVRASRSPTPHQTCTRMARADYCGDGTPHTRDGTLIDDYDTLSIQIARYPTTACSSRAAGTPRAPTA